MNKYGIVVVCFLLAVCLVCSVAAEYSLNAVEERLDACEEKLQQIEDRVDWYESDIRGIYRYMGLDYVVAAN